MNKTTINEYLMGRSGTKTSASSMVDLSKLKSIMEMSSDNYAESKNLCDRIFKKYNMDAMLSSSRTSNGGGLDIYTKSVKVSLYPTGEVLIDVKPGSITSMDEFQKLVKSLSTLEKDIKSGVNELYNALMKL